MRSQREIAIKNETIDILRTFIVNLIEGSSPPSVDGNITTGDFELWKSRMIKLIENRLPNPLL